MIVAEKKSKIAILKVECFGEVMSDGRLTQPSNEKKYYLREAIIESKRLGRPLTEEEMKKYELEN